MKKYLLQMIVLCAAFCALLCVTVSAAYSGTCGDNLTWTLNDGNGTLIISGTGAMDNCANNLGNSTAPWSGLRSKIKTVVIKDGVTTIGDMAFYDCTSLTSVTIGNSVTTIGDAVFSGCRNLEDITIPNSVTTIGSAFSNCAFLTSVTIGNSVSAIGEWAFGYCYRLTSVTIPDSVTTIGNSAFYDCRSLTDITIPDSVTTIENNAFAECYSLTSVTIGNSVTTIGDRVFNHCPNVFLWVYRNSYAYTYAEENNIPFDVLRVAYFGEFGNSMAYFLYNNGRLLIRGTGAMDNWENYDDVPWYAQRETIKTVTIENGAATIGNYAFYECKNLKSITIPDNITFVGSYAFYSCSGPLSTT